LATSWRGGAEVDLREQIAIAVQAESQRKGATTATCAGLYAVAIGSAFDAEADYWTPINDALIGAFGLRGLGRVKETAWKIHDHAARAMRGER
jgi:hypothetical protein